jgi:hypothetical protein
MQQEGRPSAEVSRWIGIIAAGLDAIAAIFVIPKDPALATLTGRWGG